MVRSSTEITLERTTIAPNENRRERGSEALAWSNGKVKNDRDSFLTLLFVSGSISRSLWSILPLPHQHGQSREESLTDDGNRMMEPELLSALRNGQDILCVSHISPDGDAIGSLLGMGWLLRGMGKRPALAIQDKVPEEHRVLPGAKDIITIEQPGFSSNVAHRPFDLIVCLDASSVDRMGAVYHEPVHKQATLVTIDHHITNTYFGDINWVNPAYAATCQMLVDLADSLNVSLESKLAECLLTGIVTDTLCFRTSNTSSAVLGTATRLMEAGADLAMITARTLNHRPFSLLRLWGGVLPTVQLEERIIWTTISRDQLAQSGYPGNDVNLSSFLVTVDEADISAVFTETEADDRRPAVECSFRAKPGFSVSEVAFSFGGGGHPPASGCTIMGTLPQVTPIVVSALKNAHQRQSENGANTARGEA